MAYKQKKFGGFGDLVQNLAGLKGSRRKMTPKDIGSSVGTIVDNLPNINIWKYKNK